MRSRLLKRRKSLELIFKKKQNDKDRRTVVPVHSGPLPMVTIVSLPPPGYPEWRAPPSLERKERLVARYLDMQERAGSVVNSRLHTRGNKNAFPGMRKKGGKIAFFNYYWGSYFQTYSFNESILTIRYGFSKESTKQKGRGNYYTRENGGDYRG